ncbi:TPA: GntR family transcriptional regulator, partial [Klebsiella quasipneumoniae subsp. similipneumoniae]
MTENLSTVENAKEKLDLWLKQGLTAAGGKLPSERELGELLGIKRMTLRQALLSLEAESRIFRKDRKGWFVAQPRFNYSPELPASFQRAAIEQGREPSWGFIEKQRTRDYPDAAKEGANKQVISSQADSLIKISRIWADFFPANTS